MKSKTFSKKLTLNKNTVADLNNGDLMNVHGGGLQYRTVAYTNCILDETIGCCDTYGCPTDCSCNPSGEPDCPCWSVKEM